MTTSIVCRSPAFLLSGELNIVPVKMTPSSSLVAPQSFHLSISVSEVHTTRNPRLVTELWCRECPSPRTNGESNYCQHIGACQSKVPPSLARIRVDSLSDCRMHVEGSQLGIGIAPPDIHPPFVSSRFTRESREDDH